MDTAPVLTAPSCLLVGENGPPGGMVSRTIAKAAARNNFSILDIMSLILSFKLLELYNPDRFLFTANRF